METYKMTVYLDRDPLYGYTVSVSPKGLELLADYQAHLVEEYNGFARYSGGFGLVNYDRGMIRDNGLVVTVPYTVTDIKEHEILVQFVKQ